MEVVYPCCCGSDVHKKSITACVLWAEAKGKSRKEKRRFGTFTHDLLQLADWLGESGVTHVAMESTGVYWKPVWNILAEQFKVLLVNAQHIKAVPGRKTDQKDSEWIADLLQHGLLQQISDPLAVFLVRLPAGHRFDVLRVHQQHLELLRKNVPHRLPVHSRGLHGYMGYAALPKPIGQLQ